MMCAWCLERDGIYRISVERIDRPSEKSGELLCAGCFEEVILKARSPFIFCTNSHSKAGLL